MESLGIALMWAGGFVLVGVFIWKHRGSREKLYCIQCGVVDFPRQRMRGSFGIELILWVCLVLPGVIYSLWRWGSVHPVCVACGSPGLIPVNSPRAMAQRQHSS